MAYTPSVTVAPIPWNVNMCFLMTGKDLYEVKMFSYVFNCLYMSIIYEEIALLFTGEIHPIFSIPILAHKKHNTERQ